MKKYLGETLLFITSLIWGFTFISQVEAMKHIGPMTFVAIRFGIGAVVLLPLLFIGRWRSNTAGLLQKPKTLSHWLGTGIIGVCLFLGAACQQIGLQYTSIANAGFLTSLYLILVPLVGFLIKQPPSLLQLFSVIIAFIGVSFLNGGFDLTQLNVGDIWNLAGTLFWTGQIWAIAYYSQQFDNGFLAVWQAVVTCVLALLTALFLESVKWFDIVAIWPHLIVAGIFASGIAYGMQIYGQRLVSPNKAVCIFALEGVIAAFFGYIILKQVLPWYGVIGCSLILIATIIAQIPTAKQKASNTIGLL